MYMYMYMYVCCLYMHMHVCIHIHNVFIHFHIMGVYYVTDWYETVSTFEVAIISPVHVHCTHCT